ncbi:unnamed protein product, partial [Nesidiocoris tenuis]
MEVLCVIYAPVVVKYHSLRSILSKSENTIPFEHWSRADSPARRRAALPEPEPGGAKPGNPSPSINDITSRPDQHGGRSDQPPGTDQQSVGATIPRSTTRAHVRSCNFMFGYPASANRLFAASVFRRVPSGSVASRSPRCTDIYVSCCGNILWFEKCNISEYAAGGHRPTRSDAAKHYAIRKSQSKVLLFGILQCFRQLQVIFHTVWRRRVKILILSPPIGDHWRCSNSRSAIDGQFTRCQFETLTVSKLKVELIILEEVRVIFISDKAIRSQHCPFLEPTYRNYLSENTHCHDVTCPLCHLSVLAAGLHPLLAKLPPAHGPSPRLRPSCTSPRHPLHAFTPPDLRFLCSQFPRSGADPHRLGPQVQNLQELEPSRLHFLYERDPLCRSIDAFIRQNKIIYGSMVN